MTDNAPRPAPEPDASVPDSPRPVAPLREPEPLWREVVGDLLRAERMDRGETLVETSRRAGVSPQYLSEMERGIKEPSSEMLAAVAGALDLTLLDLTLGVAERMAPRAVPAAVTAATFSRAAFALAA
ncbi:helix-turn-helix transcriptional regulator [Microbacterium resistens]|uniref:Helix-turn-helix domain-containing protein n=1 Tax=Microbacterium resistens TaxID=156977 RepID=A0ABY3RX36_9MICO|nr:helix-turn-helix transcriptional regulator [Microbacterium resistens]MBW1639130.1 helix-turn-helix transcriptional regulator [Microbacterium resistens]UGS27865.1 helix-turn-helix domain-containing protein [Microbacterium resistens]